MKHAIACLLVLAACGGGGSPGGDDDGDDAPSIDANPGTIDAGPGGAPDAIPPMPICAATCTVAADCAAGTPGGITDADNYACDDGACRYTGCNSTDECVVTFQDPDYTCEVAFEYPQATCWPTCTVAADCASATPVFDADNYACDDGKCRWLGCNSTQECAETYPSENYQCAVRGTSTIPNCWDPCTTAADCGSASPPFDADNYDCDDGLCVYQGCNSTTECMALGDYACLMD